MVQVLRKPKQVPAATYEGIYYDEANKIHILTSIGDKKFDITASLEDFVFEDGSKISNSLKAGLQDYFDSNKLSRMLVLDEKMIDEATIAEFNRIREERGEAASLNPKLLHLMYTHLKDEVNRKRAKPEVFARFAKMVSIYFAAKQNVSATADVPTGKPAAAPPAEAGDELPDAELPTEPVAAKAVESTNVTAPDAEILKSYRINPRDIENTHVKGKYTIRITTKDKRELELTPIDSETFVDLITKKTYRDGAGVLTSKVFRDMNWFWELFQDMKVEYDAGEKRLADAETAKGELEQKFSDFEKLNEALAANSITLEDKIHGLDNQRAADAEKIAAYAADLDLFSRQVATKASEVTKLTRQLESTSQEYDTLTDKYAEVSAIATNLQKRNEIFYALAEQFTADGNYLSALTTYQQILKLDQNDLRAWQGAKKVAMAEGNAAKANAIAKRMQELQEKRA